MSKCFSRTTIFVIYANDIKIYSIINGLPDALALQNDLALFATWSGVNGLLCNANKCEIVSFSRISLITEVAYSLRGVFLPRSNSIKDLGVIFDTMFSFTEHF